MITALRVIRPTARTFRGTFLDLLFGIVEYFHAFPYSVFRSLAVRVSEVDYYLGCTRR